MSRTVTRTRAQGDEIVDMIDDVIKQPWSSSRLSRTEQLMDSHIDASNLSELAACAPSYRTIDDLLEAPPTISKPPPPGLLCGSQVPVPSQKKTNNQKNRPSDFTRHVMDMKAKLAACESESMLETTFQGMPQQNMPRYSAQLEPSSFSRSDQNRTEPRYTSDDIYSSWITSHSNSTTGNDPTEFVAHCQRPAIEEQHTELPQYQRSEGWSRFEQQPPHRLEPVMCSTPKRFTIGPTPILQDSLDCCGPPGFHDMSSIWPEDEELGIPRASKITEYEQTFVQPSPSSTVGTKATNEVNRSPTLPTHLSAHTWDDSYTHHSQNYYSQGQRPESGKQLGSSDQYVTAPSDSQMSQYGEASRRSHGSLFGLKSWRKSQPGLLAEYSEKHQNSKLKVPPTYLTTRNVEDDETLMESWKDTRSVQMVSRETNNNKSMVHALPTTMPDVTDEMEPTAPSFWSQGYRKYAKSIAYNPECSKISGLPSADFRYEPLPAKRKKPLFGAKSLMFKNSQSILKVRGNDIPPLKQLRKNHTGENLGKTDHWKIRPASHSSCITPHPPNPAYATEDESPLTKHTKPQLGKSQEVSALMLLETQILHANNEEEVHNTTTDQNTGSGEPSDQILQTSELKPRTQGSTSIAHGKDPEQNGILIVEEWKDASSQCDGPQTDASSQTEDKLGGFQMPGEAREKDAPKFKHGNTS